MARKRKQIVDAALTAFLEQGYADSSVNRIAEDAGVSIKTLYRHFETKDELFSAVIRSACSFQSEAPEAKPGWYAERPEIAFVLAGEEFLRYAVSDEQLGLYRIVMHDAQRFPEIAEHYRREVVGRRAKLFVDYLDEWRPTMGWTIADGYGAAAVFGSLLKATWFDDALQGRKKPTEEEIAASARRSAEIMLSLLQGNML